MSRLRNSYWTSNNKNYFLQGQQLDSGERISLIFRKLGLVIGNRYPFNSWEKKKAREICQPMKR